MSWSFSGVGKPDALQRAIDADLARYSEGQSRDEYAEAAPALKALVGAAGPLQVVAVNANGHANLSNGQKT